MTNTEKQIEGYTQISIFTAILFDAVKTEFLKKFEKENNDIWIPFKYLADNYKGKQYPIITKDFKLQTINPKLQGKFDEEFTDYMVEFVEKLVKTIKEA